MESRRRGFDKDIGCEVATWTERVIGNKWYEYASRRPRRLPSRDVSSDGLLPAIEDGRVLTLAQLARHAILNDIERYNKDSFRGCPTRIGILVWRDVCQRGLDSFKSFRAFVEALPIEVANGEFQPNHGYSQPHGKGDEQEIPLPIDGVRVRTQTVLLEYGKLQNSETLRVLDSPCWLVLLSLDSSSSNLRYEYTDLLALAEIPTLAALDLSRDDYTSKTKKEGLIPVNYHIIRIWARRAAEDGKFSKLRILVLRGQYEIMNEPYVIFEQLYKFPALRYVDITACNFSRTLSSKELPMEPRRLEKTGWTYATGDKSQAEPGATLKREEVLGETTHWPMDLVGIYSSLFGNPTTKPLCVYGRACDKLAYDRAGGLYDRVRFQGYLTTALQILWLRRHEPASAGSANAKGGAKRERAESNPSASKPTKSIRMIKDKRTKELQNSFDSLLGIGR